MNLLFTQLLTQVNHFLTLGHSAPQYLTEKALLKKQPSPARLEGWQKLLTNTAQPKNKLEQSLNSSDPDHPDKEIDSALTPFRQLSRYFSEISCEWSTIYTQIDNELDNIYQTVFEIDKKYHLGKFKYQ